MIIRTRAGGEAGRGLSAYSSADIRLIAGHKSGEIAAILGYRGRDEIIHRDDLVVTNAMTADDDDRDTGSRGNRERRSRRDDGRDRAARPRGRRRAGPGSGRGAARGAAAAAAAVRAQANEILAANADDLAEAREGGIGAALLDRLALDPKRLEAIAAGLEDIAALPDPVGRVLAEWTRPNGLRISRVSVPLGVIGIIYESRPNVTADAGGLALKSGNAAILRGGSESFHSSRALVAALRDGLRSAGLPEAAIQLVPTRDRAAVGMMLAMSGVIDIIVPRGGASLIERVQRESRIPVIAHLEGLCHTYVDARRRPGEGARDRAQRQDAPGLDLRRDRDLAGRPRRRRHDVAADPRRSARGRLRVARRPGGAGDRSRRRAGDRRGLAHRISRRDPRGARRRRRRRRRSRISTTTARTTPTRS